MEAEYRKIGRMIHVLRSGKGISQGELAGRMEFSRTNLSNIERGKTAVTLKNLFKMKEIFGCSMREFFEDSPEETFNMEEAAGAVRMMKEIKKSENKGEVC